MKRRRARHVEGGMRRESKTELAIGALLVAGVVGVFVAPRYFKRFGREGDADAGRGARGVMATALETGAGTDFSKSAMPAAGKPATQDDAAPRAKAGAGTGAPPAAEQKTVAEEWRRHLADARALMAGDRHFEARVPLTKALMAAPDGAARDKLKDALYKLNEELLFSPHATPDSKVHLVAAGDSLWRISQKYNITIGLLKWTNFKKRSIVREGERLKVLVGEWRALVQKGKRRMLVFFNNQFVREYPVTIGRYGKTPEGVFTIRTKQENPTWYAPDGVYASGDAKNVLGSRWLGFERTREYQGYGIHGTTTPDDIGKAVSNGCIRLLNKDVEELYLLLRRGDKVKIVP